MMAEMEKSWEQKLLEAKENEKQHESQQKADEIGVDQPHLVNLNEDPMLDRKVKYKISQEEPLFCGRRNKDSNYKLQLGGTGILPDHCKFEITSKGCKVVCLDPRAIA